MNRLKMMIVTALIITTMNISAATLTFEYSAGDSVFSGVLLGDLQDDDDTFIVTQALELAIDDVVLDVSSFYVGLYSTIQDDLPDLPIDPSLNSTGIVSLSGQNIDLLVCDRNICAIGVVMINNVPNSVDDLFAFFSSSDLFSTGVQFDEASWSAEVVVPLPAAGWLFLGALFGIRMFGSRNKR